MPQALTSFNLNDYLRYFSIDGFFQMFAKVFKLDRKSVAAFSATALVWAMLRVFRRVSVKSILRGLPGPSSPSWFSGNFPEIYGVLNFNWHYEATRKYGNVFQINGMFGDEQLYITDARAMHQALVKEIAIFEEPQHLLTVNKVMFGDGLLSTLGSQHKRQRKVLNSVFSEKHMKELLPILVPISQKLCHILDTKTEADSCDVDIYGWASRVSLEFIAQGGMGTSLDDLSEGGSSCLAKFIKEMVPTISRLHVPMQFLPTVYPLFSTLPSRLKSIIRLYNPFAPIRNLNKTIDLIEDTSRDILERRRERPDLATGSENTFISKDILGVLLTTQRSVSDMESLPESEIIGQITTLLLTAQDTTASALSRALQVLASIPSFQQKLRSELRASQHVSAESSNACEFESYDSLMRLPLLDACVRETLRLYPPVTWIWRVARSSTVLPLRTPLNLTNGDTVSSIPVAENQGIVIGIGAAQRDRAVWGEDADEWRPERWLMREEVNDEEDGDEWKQGSVLTDETRYPGIYSGMMTFSGGGRSCIGFKFALLSLKLLLASLISRYEFRMADGKETVWHMNHIAAPTTRGDERQGAQMVLNVRRP